MLSRIDEQLKESVPLCEPPDTLHKSIMVAIRSAGPEAAPARHAPFRWAAAIGCAIMLLGSAGVYVGTRQSPASPVSASTGPAMAAPETALSVGDRLSRAAPAAIVAPMERELELINRDIESTRQLLLASLP